MHHRAENLGGVDPPGHAFRWFGGRRGRTTAGAPEPHQTLHVDLLYVSKCGARSNGAKVAPLNPKLGRLGALNPSKSLNHDAGAAEPCIINPNPKP